MGAPWCRPADKVGSARPSEDFSMPVLTRILCIVALVSTAAACASAPPPPPPQVIDLAPPHPPRLDAKTQLETGRGPYR
jgi:hypothetical protein